MKWHVEDSVLQAIAVKGKGTPRLALRLLESAHRVSRSLGEQDITQDHLQHACDLEQIDELGLGPTEQKYLQIISSGPTRLNVISSTLGLPSRTVSEVTEPYLIRSGLIAKDDQGRRTITAKGQSHLSNKCHIEEQK